MAAALAYDVINYCNAMGSTVSLNRFNLALIIRDRRIFFKWL